ncbi:MAG: hypothetical protein B6I36_01790 [Desulfobacteraceae bacterium 4572_35.1]|nr:MAG: hypothetical protein B6I36_01790 [Desulfobacteraceae bacterium 4572_35.1]
MFRNTLFAKLFLLLLVAVAIIIPGVYYFTIPAVDRHIYQLEEHAGKTTLDTIYTLLSQTERDLAAWHKYSIASHKRQLKDIVNIAAESLHLIYHKYERGQLSYAEAKAAAIAQIKAFRYGNNDYLYLCDYDANFIFHPDPELDGINSAQLKDINGQLIVPPMIARARSAGAGYHEYWWNRLGTQQPIRKITYTQDLPEWGWVVGSGVYVADIQRDTEARKNELIAFLRDFIRTAKIATSGYLYVFDGDLNMIIHPNSNIEKTNFSGLKNPLTGQSIGQELIAAAGNKDNKLIYQWDKPSDPGNYSYQKVAWVRYLPEYDYYVTSSVYTEDLKSSGNLLAKRLFHVSIAEIFLIMVLGLLLIYNVTGAIKKLVQVTDKIVDGDLSEHVKIERNDEIGQLGNSFNLMVDRLKEQIDTLESRVAERTAAQTQLVAQLEQNNVETTMLKEANEMLQECRNVEEVYRAVHIIMRKAFPATSGSLFSLGYEGQRLEVVSDWNCEPDNLGKTFPYDTCFAMRRGGSYVFASNEEKLPCSHLGTDVGVHTICVLISAYGDIFGVLHVQHESVSEQRLQRMLSLIEDIAEYTAGALANLRLRSRLRQQSVRDPLTGLFNRRYMDEVLAQEESRADRNASQVGIIMIDVDHFKKFNDTYGHEAGDEILRVLGKVLRDYFRESDIVCRYGGEEFIIILPDITLGQCQAKAEQLRDVVENNCNIFFLKDLLGITISLGIALYPLHNNDMRMVLKLADDALYQAKAEGRNRVVSASVTAS